MNVTSDEEANELHNIYHQTKEPTKVSQLASIHFNIHRGFTITPVPEQKPLHYQIKIIGFDQSKICFIATNHMISY